MERGERRSPVESGGDRWGFESHFQEYGFLLARKGKEGLESIDNFPKQIELSGEWHETLNKMREETRDGFERIAYVGSPETLRKLSIPPHFTVGTELTINPETLQTGLQRVKERGMGEVVGYVHSHTNVNRKMKYRLMWLMALITDYHGFSTGDLHWVLTSPKTNYFIHGLVDDQANYFTFLTRETRYIPPDSNFSSKEKFNDYWTYDYPEANIRTKGRIRFPKLFTVWDINTAIARHYNLALYRGKPWEDLIRANP